MKLLLWRSIQQFVAYAGFDLFYYQETLIFGLKTHSGLL